ncbi:transporter associated domain-containing protein [Thiomicrorhabdus sp. zzn3]|uniref:HlyC/CorC family transporter n=1 Tax=Thiomicrorhabdus sp. zzn3 TaxID=3039775 RepID=UPI002436FE7B|nr:transporter associated domain-containing protein [Thiomicrorhabdus sp. zzn3]MDG6779103.1 transporter associated domain-containing protein [Thiomicrorhabdus sp. zzn3]
MSDSSSGSSWLERLGKIFSGEPESREDLLEMIKEAQSQGVIDSDAQVMIEGVLNVSEARVRDIMIPRMQIEVVDASESLEVILENMLTTSHSRYPVIEGSQGGRIVGVLLAKDVFRAVVKGELTSKEELEAIYRQPTFVPESKRLNMLLHDFKASRNHMALVVDEYGELAGLVTIEDVLEQIVGDIADEHDVEEDSTIQKHVGGAFTVQAITSLDEFNAFFHVELPMEKSETIGGLLALELGHVPVEGEEIELYGLHFKVLKATERRAELFQVKPLEASSELAELEAV